MPYPYFYNVSLV